MVKQVTLADRDKYGIKRTCRSCGVNFYDLEKHPPSECPNCGALYELHVSARNRRVVDDIVAIDETSAFEDFPFEIEEQASEVTPEPRVIDDDDPFNLDINSDED